MLREYHTRQGIGGLGDKFEVLGVMGNERLKLNAEEDNLGVKAYEFSRLPIIFRFVFIQNFGIVAMNPGILIAWLSAGFPHFRPPPFFNTE
jgi:hypothetical protein